MVKRKDSRKAKKKQPQRPLNGQTLRDAVAWAVDQRIFAHLKAHGNTTWQVADLILLAVVWVWSNDATLTGAFAEAHRWSLDVLERAAVRTYRGLLKALVTWTASLLPPLRNHLHRLMEQHGGSHWRVGRWVPLAVDGSRISVPRTKGNEKAFCAPEFGKSRTAEYRRKKRAKGKRQRQGARRTRRIRPATPVKPQIWITLLWHMGLQMPWSWKMGPSNASEREHFRDMVDTHEFPKKTLFCCDAGFTGYGLWKALGDAGHGFLIRVGANVKLLRKLGYVRECASAGIVYCWPDEAARRGQPPLVLRHLRLRVGRCLMHLVTNVLDEKSLSVADAIRLYGLRWGVELQFRTVKQTFGRRKLRSRTPARAYVELDWSLVGLWLIQLFAVKAQVEIGEVPEHCSVAMAIQVVRETCRRWWERPEEAFPTRLRSALKETYTHHSSRKARYRPDYKDKPKAGTPVIREATAWHKAKLKKNFSMAA
jgi:DDE family transposase